jgi:hypothetical protein
MQPGDVVVGETIAGFADRASSLHVSAATLRPRADLPRGCALPAAGARRGLERRQRRARLFDGALHRRRARDALEVVVVGVRAHKPATSRVRRAPQLV